MTEIYCDESGYTGDDLLEANQPYFVYCGVKLTLKEKDEINRLIRNNYKVQGNEIKGKLLVQNIKGQNAILKVFDSYADKARIVFSDKKYVLACKIFEYVVEPNLANNSLAYQTDFHRFISVSLYIYFIHSENKAEELFELFLSVLRGQSPGELLLNIDHNKIEYSILKWTLEVAKANPNVFYSEIHTEGKIDKWILDLTSTALMGILTDWSKNGNKLTVICDKSNLFKNNILINGLNEIGKANVRTDFLGHTMGFGLTQDIKITDSKDEVGLQIADIFSSSVGYSLNNQNEEFSKKILEFVYQKTFCTPQTYCVMPDAEIPSRKNISFYMNYMGHILESLSK